MLISEIVGQWRIPKPPSVPVTKQTKPKRRKKTKHKPRPFNQRKPDNLS